MMNFIKGAILAGMLVISGCAGMGVPQLDTNEDRLAAAELTFDQVTELAIKLHPRLSEDRRDNVRDAISCLHEILVGARVALSVKDSVDFSNQIKALQSGIAILRPILIELEENGDVNSFEFDCIA